MTTKASTKKVGDQFESKSLGILNKIIEEERLGHLAEYLKIFPQKEYYSHLRKANIIFDLAIEVWPPGATRYTLLYLIECKDYDKRVPVGEIEKFLLKIQQVSGVNVKGIFITNSPLQKGGFNIAESVGMMVIQGESSENFKIILHKTNRGSVTDRIPFIKETYDATLLDEGVQLIEKGIDKKILSILQESTDGVKVSYGIDRLSREDVTQKAEFELNKINPRILADAYTLNPNSLNEYLRKEYEIDLVDLDGSSDLLGSCDILNNRIGLSRSIKGTSRELFVLAHEFGHFILHQKLSIGQTQYEAFEDSQYNFRTNKYELTNPKHWIEWQANCFASSLVLPKAPFLARVWRCQETIGMRQGPVYLDDQSQNRKDFNELVKKLAYVFSVSKTSVIHKLEEMEYINDQSRLKSIGRIIDEYKSEFFT